GAAGALAFGLSGFIGARLVRGTPFIMKLLKWQELARQASLILTGEGRLDKTSFSGKVIGEIVGHRGRAGVYVVCGAASLTNRDLKRRGIEKVELMGKKGLKDPSGALARATSRLFKSIRYN